MSDAAAAARAIDAVRRGWPVSIDGTDGALAVLPIETADGAQLAAFDPDQAADVLISAGRATTLKLANQIDAAAPEAPVQVRRVPWLDFDAATALADPALDLASPLKGPFRTLPLIQPALAAAAMRLARMAGVLPAFFIRPGATAQAIVTPDDLFLHDAPARLRIATRARLPVEGAEDAEIVAFRTADGGDTHVALLIGAPTGQPPLVRLHSECLTGDVLGSLKCDCGPQLRAAIAAIRESGWGILLYLRQEGRGIGLINKLRAYALQDQGFDTVDANIRLGFEVDARDFGIAAQMLQKLGQRQVRLLTNNPAKAAALAQAGIDVERVPHALPPNPHNARYLATKRDRTGHQL